MAPLTLSRGTPVENHSVKVSFVTLNQALMEFDMTLSLKKVSNVRFYRPNFLTYFRCFCFPNGEHKNQNRSSHIASWIIRCNKEAYDQDQFFSQ